MELMLLWLGFAFLVALYARSKGFSGFVSFLFACILSPLIAAAIIAMRKPNVSAIEARATSGGQFRKCPACAEFIKSEASKCKHCGEAVEPLPIVDPYAGGG